MKKVVESRKFLGYRFEGGDVAFHISKYTYDTIIMSEKWGINFRSIKEILLLFEVMAELKVNL